jgi:hypothetical protein
VTRATSFAGVLFGVAVSASALLFAEPRLTPVTQAEVWQAVAAELREQGIVEASLPQVDDLDLPVAVPAPVARKLRVVSACWDAGSERTQFRLQCGEAGECLPFLVYWKVSPRNSHNGEASAHAVSCRVPIARTSPKVALKPAMRSGDRALVVFVAAQLHMSARVTCLEGGREGDVIRVRDTEGRIFRARVSGPARLEALPLSRDWTGQSPVTTQAQAQAQEGAHR